MKHTATRTGPRVRGVGRTPAAAQKPVARKKESAGLPPRAWRLAGAAVLAAAGLLRLMYLTLAPLHHDEGVNGLFMATLFRSGFYQYNPANYHGPTLYYFGLATSTLNSFIYGKAGLSTFSIRLVPAIFGIATVGLLLGLRRKIGAFGATAAAALMTVSTGNVYFSRYFIHEVPLVFFTLSLVMSLAWYRETTRARYAMLAAASAALIFATKETSIISFAVLGLAYLCSLGYMHWKNPPAPRVKADAGPGAENAFASFMRNNALGLNTILLAACAALSFTHRDLTYKILFALLLGAVDACLNVYIFLGKRSVLVLASAICVFVAVSVLFYSSFFGNFPQGVYDSVRTFTIWSKTGTTQYVGAWYTYFKWLSDKEAPILLLGAAGIGAALWQARNRFAVFTAFWAMGITAAYSLVPYKTPWLTLNLILPLAIASGYGLDQLYELGLRERSRGLRSLALGVALAAVAYGSYQAIYLSFVRYDDNDQTYVYAHTVRDFEALIHEIEQVGAHNHLGTNTGIVVMAPEYWPMPWYLRDYPNAGYWGKVVETKEPVVIALDSQIPEVERTLGNEYVRFNTYEMRPGNQLVLYLRRGQRP